MKINQLFIQLIFLKSFFFFLCFSVNAQAKKVEIILTETRVEYLGEDKILNEYNFMLHSKLRIKNNTNKTLFIPNFEITCGEKFILESANYLDKGNYVYLESFGSSSTFSSDWESFKGNIIENGPNPVNSYRIAPNSSIFMDYDFSLKIPKEKSISYLKKYNLNQLKKMPNLFFFAKVSFWPKHLETKSMNATNDYFYFAKKIRKKWQKIGIFLYEDTYSEPFKLILPDVAD